MRLHHLLPLFYCPLLPAFQETWESGYAGEDAAGRHVLAYWTFDGEEPLSDSSGKGADLTLNGARLSPDGRRGGALESFAGHPISNKPHQARAASKARLSPNGAFTIDLWMQPKVGFEDAPACYLLDKKYTPDTHTDFSLQMSAADKAGARRLLLALGLGSHSVVLHSEPLRLEAGQWRHLAVSYDAAGTATFYLDGSIHSRATRAGLGATVPGSRPLTLGDRNGSNYAGFHGLLDEVRLCEGVLKFEPVEVTLASARYVWRRMEQPEPVQVHCVNLRRETVSGARLRIDFGGIGATMNLPDLLPGKTHTVPFIPDTTLKSGPYALRARLEAAGAVASAAMEVQLAARPVPGQMPVVMWGASGGEIPRLKDIGFTHFIGFGTGVGGVWETKSGDAPPGDPDYIKRNRALLDDALAAGLNVVCTTSPASFFDHKPEFHRVDRDGRPFARTALLASHPELPAFFENVGRSLARAYGSHPAFTTVLVNSEVRDASRPSFNPIDIENYRAFSGGGIPAEVDQRSGVDYSTITGFPANRVVPDDHPILRYYRWFWTEGDGWNALHSALHRGVKSADRRDLWTFFDPAVRQPSISGAGGEVDVLSHWTYTYPDPQRIGLATDQLFAMSAASGRNQKVMKMTQIIWYRSQTAPAGKTAPENPVPWEDHDPDAAYITIAPMHLKQAFWTKLSRPVQGIMYHGWQSLVPVEDSASSYRHTHPGTVEVLKQLIHEVARPFGPMLLKVPDERREIALLESFTSQIFARRGGHGYNSTWSADLWLALQHAHLPPDIVFEETLLQNGLTGRRLLVMPECDVLSASVLEKIQAWQQAGGKILADEHLCPALKADFVIPSFKRVKNAAQDKARVLQTATEIKRLLAAAPLSPAVSADHPEVILRTRRAGTAAYLFLINDQREPGGYVGQHGLVMENGLPTATTITLPMETAHLYDLTRRRQVIPARDPQGRLQWSTTLGPCEGRLFLILPEPLFELRLKAPTTAARGSPVKLSLQVLTAADQPANAVLPIRLDIRDASGVPVEGTGYYAAEKGELEVVLLPAVNDEPGTWEIHATELASGLCATHYMALQP